MNEPARPADSDVVKCPFAHAISGESAPSAASASATSSSSSGGAKLTLVAHSAWGFNTPIVPAYTERDWMTATSDGFAYHCLPLTLANQSGWFVLATHDARATWNGGKAPADIEIHAPSQDEQSAMKCSSAVGHGILTWTLSYVFRTPPGWNLLCRGPANFFVDGLGALEGLIETDWSMASFSANWRFTRPCTIEFKKGDPIAMLVPHRRGDLEAFDAKLAEMKDNPSLDAGYRAWVEARKEFLDNKSPERTRFQKHYFHGRRVDDDTVFDAHQKRRTLAQFERRDTPAATDDQSSAGV